MTFRYLRRYTNLASTLHLLQNRHLTLLNPNTWDDRNDAYFLSEYKKQVGAKSVLALCFAATGETYHHWSVFSGGSDGVCIEFDFEKLSPHLDKEPCLSYKSVMYKEVSKVAGTRQKNLPFVKRWPYRHEREFRLLYVDMEVQADFASVHISLSSIARVMLSPWMAKPLVDAVRKSIKSINGCESLKVYRSTLIENEKWKRAANKA